MALLKSRGTTKFRKINYTIFLFLEGGIQHQVNPLAFNDNSHNIQMNDLNTTTQSDMAEADQLQIPDSAVDQVITYHSSEIFGLCLMK